MRLQKAGPRQIPPERRCCEVKTNGQRCGSMTVEGEKRCHIHGFYRHLNNGSSNIDVPLLEDENAILFVYSQVARALTYGVMPASNGNGIIRCCAGAQRLLENRRKQEQLAARKSVEEVDGLPDAESQDTAEGRQGDGEAVAMAETESERCDMPAEACGEGAGECAVTSDAGTMEETTAASELAESAIGDEDGEPEEPQRWRDAQPMRTIVPPPQFARSRTKFDNDVQRMSGKMMDSILQRDREIRARGGWALPV